ncbi:MAG: hypothetical protein LBD59_01775 [Prevotellaceae bacterium]|jgi:hypothetical protein|nr:hypothetical protein [Prevotellaceae bacterium]
MKRFLLTIALITTSIAYLSAQQTGKEDAALKSEAAKIAKELSLDAKNERLVYNVLNHVKTRIAGVPLGHEKYAKLIGYIDEERVGMMKALLTSAQYKRYETAFGASEKQKVAQLLAKNTEHVKVHGVLVTRVSGADIIDDQFFDKSDENADNKADDDAEEVTAETEETANKSESSGDKK